MSGGTGLHEAMVQEGVLPRVPRDVPGRDEEHARRRDAPRPAPRRNVALGALGALHSAHAAYAALGAYGAHGSATAKRGGVGKPCLLEHV